MRTHFSWSAWARTASLDYESRRENDHRAGRSDWRRMRCRRWYGGIAGSVPRSRVGIARPAVDDDLYIRSENLAGLSLKPLLQGAVQPAHDAVVRDSAPGHRDRLEAVELVTCRLAFLPGEERRQRHRLAQRHVQAINASIKRL